MDDEQDIPEGSRPRPKVVDKRISARAASGEAAVTPAPGPAAPQPAAPPEPAAEEPRAPDGGAASGPAVQPGATEHEPPPTFGSGSTGAPKQQVWTPEQEAQARAMAEEMARVGARDWVLNAAVTLANVAAVKIETGALADATIALDALAGIVEAVGPKLEGAEQALRNTLTQLRLAFADAASPPPTP